jgi:hypothetical protein
VSEEWLTAVFVIPHLAIGIFVLWRVSRSLKTGVNDWTDFGRLVRAPGDYDFWVVNFLFAAIAAAFVCVAAYVIFQAIL